jgi:YD repeat-containing protein
MNEHPRWAARTTGKAITLMLSTALAVLALAAAAGASAIDEERPPAAEESEGFRRAELERTKDARRERRRLEDEEAKRRTPKAREERKRSRSAYEESDGDEALTVAEAKFGELIDDPLWAPPSFGDNERPGAYLGENAQLVEREGESSPSVIDSTLPLRAETESGEQAPVAIELEDAGEAFKPKNPLAKTRVAKRAADGIAFEQSGVKVRPEASGAARQGTRTEGKVFYPDTDTDTDFMVAPLPTGVETFHQLRSAKSPERHALDFDLPAGAQLRATGDRFGPTGAEVVRGEERLTTVGAPTATDAEGRAVPVSYAVEGDRLTLKVDHRAGDWRYPILVDPVIEDYYWRNTAQSDPRHHFDPWTWQRNGTIFEAQDGPYGRGLYIHKDAANVYDGWWGRYYYQAPGTPTEGAFIYRTDFYESQHEPYSSCVFQYIQKASGALENPDSYHRQCDNNYMNGSVNVAGSPRNAAVFQLSFYGTFRRTRTTRAYMGAARVYLHDNFKPAIPEPVQHVDATGAAAPPPSGWTNQPIRYARIRGTDGGIGVKRYRVEASDGRLLGETVVSPSACRGGAVCPRDLWQTVRYEVPPGSHTLRAVVRDNVENASDPTSLQTSAGQPAQVKLDTKAPELGLSGQLKDKDGQWLKVEGSSLRVEATDVDATLPQSGVKSIEVTSKGLRKRYEQQDCPDGGCAMDRDFVFQDMDFDEGDNAVEVLVTDHAGNVARKSLTVRVDRSAPSVTTTGSLKDAENTRLEASSYELNVAAVDGDPANPRSGVRSIEILVDGVRKDYVSQGCASENCPLARSWTFKPADYGDGEHVVTVRSDDQLANATEQSFRVGVGAGTGELPRYEFERQRLSDRLELAVNVANGNLLLRGTDHQTEMTETTDLEYAVERFYNSLSTRSSPTGGLGWSTGQGRDAALSLRAGDGAVSFEGPTGYIGIFTSAANGNFDSPAGLDQRLVRNDDGTYTMTATESGDELRFTAAGLLSSRTDVDGGRTEWHYNDGGRLSSITDSDERVFSFSYDSAGYRMVDPDGGEHRYELEQGPLNTGRLNAYTAPNGDRTEYSYDLVSGKLVKIRERGSETLISYDQSGRVETIVRDPGLGGLGGRRTAYSYPELGTTVSTDPDGRRITYRHDRSSVVTSAEGGATPPSLELSGTLKEQDGQTLSREEDYELTTQASAIGGVSKTELSLDRTPELPAQQECSSGCGDLSGTFPLSGDDLPEGESFARVTATDAAGDTRMETLRVKAPPVPPAEPVDDAPLADADAEGGEPAPAEEPPAPAPAPSSAQPSDSGEPVGAAAAQGGFDPLVLGISDNSRQGEGVFSEFFRDPQIDPDRPRSDPSSGLRVRRVRRGVPWNVAELPAFLEDFRLYKNEIDRQSDELEKVGQARIEIMVVFYAGCTQVRFGAEADLDKNAYQCSNRPENPNWSPYPGNNADKYLARTGFGTFVDRFRTRKNNFRQEFGPVEERPGLGTRRGLTAFTPFNEPNFPKNEISSGSPFQDKTKGPGKAAGLFFGFNRRNCPTGCDLVAADIAQGRAGRSGRGSWVSYAEKYREAIRERYLNDRRNTTNRPYPAIWGFHPYRDLNVLRYNRAQRNAAGFDANELPRFGIKKFIRVAGRGRQVWISEVGSQIDARLNEKTRGKPLAGDTSTFSQQGDTRYLLDTLARTAGRVNRLYYHSLCGGDANFDAALVGAPGDPGRPGCDSRRPAYSEYQRTANDESRAR